jgi:hypothetical protein
MENGGKITKNPQTKTRMADKPEKGNRGIGTLRVLPPPIA